MRHSLAGHDVDYALDSIHYAFFLDTNRYPTLYTEHVNISAQIHGTQDDERSLKNLWEEVKWLRCSNCKVLKA